MKYYTSAVVTRDYTSPTFSVDSFVCSIRVRLLAKHIKNIPHFYFMFEESDGFTFHEYYVDNPVYNSEYEEVNPALVFKLVLSSSAFKMYVHTFTAEDVTMQLEIQDIYDETMAPQPPSRQLNFFDLADAPSNPVDGYFVKSTQSELVLDMPSLIDLRDTPSVYEEGKILICKGTHFEYTDFTFDALIDTPSDYVNGGFVASTGTGLVYRIPTFLDLLDTPSSYAGQSGKVLAVKSDESGLEFADAVQGASTFLELTDTPSSYAGHEGEYVVVNDTGTGLEFQPPAVSDTFIGLTDTPSVYEDGKFLRSSTSSIVFSDISFLDLVDTPAVYDDGKFLKSTGSGIVFTDISFLDLSDTPSYYDEGKFLRVQGGQLVYSTVATDFLSLTDTPSYYDDGKLVQSTSSGLTYVDIAFAPDVYVAPQVESTTTFRSGSLYSITRDVWSEDMIACLYANSASGYLDVTVNYQGSYYTYTGVISYPNTQWTTPDELYNKFSIAIYKYDNPRYYMLVFALNSTGNLQFIEIYFDTSSHGFGVVAGPYTYGNDPADAIVAADLGNNIVGCVLRTPGGSYPVYMYMIDCANNYNTTSTVLDSFPSGPMSAQKVSDGNILICCGSYIYGYNRDTYWQTPALNLGCDFINTYRIDNHYSVAVFSVSGDIHATVIDAVQRSQITLPILLGSVSLSYTGQADIAFSQDRAIVTADTTAWALNFDGYTFRVDENQTATISDLQFMRGMFATSDGKFHLMGYTASALKEVVLTAVEV